MKEVAIAYPQLKRDWASVGGYIVRLRPPGVRGIPDFALFHRKLGSALCEIKCQDSPNAAIGIDQDQIEMLHCIVNHGGDALCLAWCLQTRCWAIFESEELNVRTRWNQASRLAHSGAQLLEALSNVAMGNSVCRSTNRTAICSAAS